MDDVFSEINVSDDQSSMLGLMNDIYKSNVLQPAVMFVLKSNDVRMSLNQLMIDEKVLFVMYAIVEHPKNQFFSQVSLSVTAGNVFTVPNLIRT